MKKLKLFTEASCYYILIRVIIFIFRLIFIDLFEQFNYHHSNEWIWYLIWWIGPIAFSIFLAKQFRFKFFLKTGYLLLPVIMIATICLGIWNKKSWGYFFKRPAIFSEVKNIEKINAISIVSTDKVSLPFNIEEERYEFQELNDDLDPYYGNMDRMHLTIIENAPKIIQSFQRNNSTSKVSNDDLTVISNKIEESNLIVAAERGYAERGEDRLHGIAVEFNTNSKSRYLYIALSGGQISNDHYPFYEFLFEKSISLELSKKQMYFVDFAGIEGAEYCNIAPPIELLCFIVCGILILLFNGIQYFKGKRNRDIKTLIDDQILDQEVL